MTAASVTGGPVMSLSYDAVGNLKSKSLTGNADPASDYALSFLHSPDGARLTQIQGDLAATIVTDANGNITSRGTLSVSWTPFNKPQSITRNGETSSFKYGPERARYRQDYTEAGETITRFYVGRLFEAVHRNSVTEYHHHILAAGEVVATHIRRSNQVHATHWVLKDHQGSVDVVLDENQQEVGRTTFDAFGGRRSAGWDGLPEPGTIVGGVREFTSRGYTGHEQLDGMDIIHMNGRVYDPLIGRFQSPDPIVARPFSSQGWNRFAYVSNNPLSRIDPSGFRASIMPPTKCTGDCTGSNAGYIPGGSGSGGHGGSSEGRGLSDERIRQGVATILGGAAGSAFGPIVGAMVNGILSHAGPSSGAIGYSMPSLSGGGQANSAVNRDSSNAAFRRVERGAISGSVTASNHSQVGNVSGLAWVGVQPLAGLNNYGRVPSYATAQGQLNRALQTGNRLYIVGAEKQVALARLGQVSRASAKLGKLGTGVGLFAAYSEADKGKAGYSKVALYAAATVITMVLPGPGLALGVALVTSDVGGVLSPITLQVDSMVSD